MVKVDVEFLFVKTLEAGVASAIQFYSQWRSNWGRHAIISDINTRTKSEISKLFHKFMKTILFIYLTSEDGRKGPRSEGNFAL